VDSVDITDGTWAARRRYKTRWERAKRKRLRESSVEVVELEIPRSLAKKLHCWTPKRVAFKNFLLRLLSAGVGGKPVLESVVVEERVVVARNARCPCGSGLKWKRCCGQGK
jgi:uncharacterized protein YecA (UPF0149 family)